MKHLIFIFIICLVSCEREIVKEKTIEEKKSWTSYDNMLNTLHRYPLHYLDSTNDILRFTYNALREDLDRFYEINLNTRNLTYIEFHCPNPKLTYGDTILHIYKVRLHPNDIDTLNYLIEASMIWSLEEFDCSSGYFDCDGYLYEAKRPTRPYERSCKTYTILYRHCPQNTDFIKLGNFLKYKAKSKNWDGKIYYWQ